MSSHPLQSNAELLSFLTQLSVDMKSRGKYDLAKELLFASGFASGSPSEFLHEAQEALKKVRTECVSILPDAQLDEIRAIIRQIEVAFIRVGGA